MACILDIYIEVLSHYTLNQVVNLYPKCNNRFSLKGARDSVDDALEAVASPENASYIRREWQASLPMWANSAREHSALLLQVA